MPALGGPAITTHRPSRKPLAARGAGKRRVDLVGQRPSDRERAVDEILRHVAFVGKVDRGLDLRQRLDRARAPGLGAVAEQAAHLLERLPALRLGLGADQVGERLDLGEVELAVLEGAARELAGLRHPQARDPAERRQRGGDHGAAAVELKLGHVLAGLAARPGKPQHQRLVDRLAGGGVAHVGQRRLARLRHAADQRLERGAGARAGYPDHGDRGRRPAGGEGEDGVVGGGHERPIPAADRPGPRTLRAKFKSRPLTFT